MAAGFSFPSDVVTGVLASRWYCEKLQDGLVAELESSRCTMELRVIAKGTAQAENRPSVESNGRVLSDVCSNDAMLS